MTIALAIVALHHAWLFGSTVSYDVHIVAFGLYFDFSDPSTSTVSYDIHIDAFGHSNTTTTIDVPV